MWRSPEEAEENEVVALGAIGLFAAFMAFGTVLKSSPDAKARQKDRESINYCWEDQKRKSHDARTAQLVAATCEGMEAAFRIEHGLDP